MKAPAPGNPLRRESPAFAALLRCPRCRERVLADGDVYRCSSRCCAFSSDRGFPTIRGQPVLLDGEMSAIEPGDLRGRNGSSPIRRRAAGWADWLLQTLRLTSAHQSRRNCSFFLSLLPTQTRGGRHILVIGGGVRGAGTEPLYLQQTHDLVTFDVYASADTQFIADAHAIPLCDESVEGVWIQAVLEHVVEPARVVDEIHRVLETGGVVYSEVPFMQHVHEGAYDFSRFTLSGHRYLYRRFDAVKTGIIGGVGTQLTWAIDYFVRGITRSRRLGKLAKAAFVWLVWFDGCGSVPHSIDAAAGTFFLGRKSEKMLSHREIVAFYEGAG